MGSIENEDVMGGGGSPEFNDAAIRAPLGEVTRLSQEEWHRAKEVLQEEGVVVFEGVATPEEVEEAKNLFWQWTSRTGLGIRRCEPLSMKNSKWKQLGYIQSGVIAKLGVGQSDMLWYCRQLPSVQRLFSIVWETEDLITSYDGCGAFRNPFIAVGGEDWYTKTGWYHVDQNGNIEPGLECYQGLLNLIDVTSRGAGSTVVVPASHYKFQRLFRDECRKSARGNLVKVDQADDFDRYLKTAIQVPLRAGDFLMWDSRVIHCNQGIDKTATVEEVLPGRETDPLARLVAYICMLPRSAIPAEKREEVAKMRENFVLQGYSGPHHPIKLPDGGCRVDSLPGYKPPQKRDPIWKLV